MTNITTYKTVLDFQGVRTTKIYEVTKDDLSAINKIEKLREISYEMETTWVDNGINDVLAELYFNYLNNDCKLIDVKQEKIND